MYRVCRMLPCPKRVWYSKSSVAMRTHALGPTDSNNTTSCVRLMGRTDMGEWVESHWTMSFINEVVLVSNGAVVLRGAGSRCGFHSGR